MCRFIILEFKERECEQEEAVVDAPSSLWSERPFVKGDSEGESAEILTLFRHEVKEQILGDFLGHDPKKKDARYVTGTIMSTARPYGLVVTLVCCLVKKKNLGGHRRKCLKD